MDASEAEPARVDIAATLYRQVPKRRPTGDQKRLYPIQAFDASRLNQPGEIPYAGMTLLGAQHRIPRHPQPGELDSAFAIEDIEERAAWLLDNVVYAGCSLGVSLVQSVRGTFNGEIAQGLLMPVALKPSTPRKPSRSRRKS